jgi:hypothetical protein
MDSISETVARQSLTNNKGGNAMRHNQLTPDSSKYEIERRIKYHQTMKDFYSANARHKREQQKEINYWTKILEEK